MTSETNSFPTWAGSVEALARRVKPVLHLFKMGASVMPSEISDLVRPAGSTKDYSAKYITFLRLLGFDFSVVKEGRKIVSYTVTVVPANVSSLENVAPKAPKVKAPKEPKAPKAPKVKAPKAEKAPKAKKAAAAKKSAPKIARGGNPENLAKLKEIGKKFKKESFEEVLEEEVAPTTFSVDGDWDSLEGVDLSKII
jgi:hypothetical protein